MAEMNLTAAAEPVRHEFHGVTAMPYSAAFGETRALDRLIWAMIAGCAAVDLLVTSLTSFRVAWGTFLTAAIAATAVLLLASFYCRRDLRIAATLSGTAQLIA